VTIGGDHASTEDFEANLSVKKNGRSNASSELARSTAYRGTRKAAPKHSKIEALRVNALVLARPRQMMKFDVLSANDVADIARKGSATYGGNSTDARAANNAVVVFAAGQICKRAT